MNRGTEAFVREEDEFNEEAWEEEEFDEKVSHNSSRYGDSSIYVPAQGNDNYGRSSGVVRYTNGRQDN